MPAWSPSSAAELAAHGITIEHAACALCGHDDAEPVVVGIDRLHPLPGRFQVVRCRQCGLMRTDPRPTPASIGRYYPRDYEPYRRPELRLSKRSFRWYPVGDARHPCAPPGRLLEWGTSHGLFLEAMQQRGWDVAGIELDSAMAAAASARTGVAVLNGDVCSASFPPASFDVICAWMVLEHLHDPVAALRRAHEWLAPGGTLCLSVPDAGARLSRMMPQTWFGLDVPRHLYHFSVETLDMTLRACGFEEMSVTWPSTAHDVAYTLINAAGDRGWADPLRLRGLLESLPVRMVLFGSGLVLKLLQQGSLMTICARRSATIPKAGVLVGGAVVGSNADADTAADANVDAGVEANTNATTNANADAGAALTSTK